MITGDVSSLIDSKKVKPIRTENFVLEGYLLMWKDVMIDVDNISMVTASDLPAPPLPVYSILTFVAGCILATLGEEAISTVLVLVGMIWFGIWLYQVYNIRGHKCLNFFLNSGYTYSIVFTNDAFLEEVLTTLVMIFKEGINEETLCTFNIEKCSINGAIVNKGTIRNS